MIIHSLRVSGYQIIGDPIQLVFPESGRIGIFGANESGKSTLMEAVEFALYGLRRGRGAVEEAKENIVTWGKDEAKVEVEFSSGRESYKLSRSLSSRGHHARLVSVGGEENTRTYLTSLTEIESQIERTTGMDRESFTKLVYIKQKDLDALKDLKAKREQLIDKVMGIEIFDDAAKRAKEDQSELEKQILKKDADLAPIRKNAKQYEETLTQQSALKKEIEDVEARLDAKTKELSSAKAISDGYSWLFAFNSKKSLIESKINERTRIKSDMDRIGQLSNDNVAYEKAVDTFNPEATRLAVIHDKLVHLEMALEQQNAALSRLEVARDEAVEKHNLTDRELELSSHDLQKAKSSYFVQFMTLMIVSVVLIVAGSLTRIALILAGLVAAAIAAIPYMRYRRTDKLVGLTSDVQSLNKQISNSKSNAELTQREIDRVGVDSGLRSVSEVDSAISKINDQVMQTTGQSSIQAVEALIQNNVNEIKRLEGSKPQAQLKTLDDEILEEQNAIQELDKSKPSSANELQYDPAAHSTAQGRTDEFQGQFKEIDNERHGKLAIASRLAIELGNLKNDHDRLPKLETEYAGLIEKKMLLELVLQELGETSKKLRSQVLPQARLIVNQILPILTDGRYSELEITEDLKFKAHSIDAGGYKEREIFSGGTQDQFLIALRLAFTESILDSRVMADRYCLLMDECISSSDDQRKQGIFEVLDAVKKTFSQIFVIAHEDISNVTDHHLVLSRNKRGYTEIRSKSW